MVSLRFVASFFLPLVSIAALPEVADACGVFCGLAPPEMPPLPVDQTGEDILFAADETSIEVHVRIQYEGASDEFGWIVPMLSVPTGFAVGSDALFDAIKESTVPEYDVEDEPNACSGGVSMSGSSMSPSTGPGMTSGPGTGEPDVTVFSQQKVGAFEIVVLTGTAASEVLEWLGDNGYIVDPDAEPILDEYIAEGHVFGAIKLQSGGDVEEIHPVVFEFDHPEPCVPLRLTRLAAVEDLQLRVYYLGDHRAVPTNYRHVVINPLMVQPTGSNYAQAVAAAVDSEPANGRAFVTEFAGSTNIVSRGNIEDWRWNATAFVDIPLENIGTELFEQALYQCDEWTGECAGTHPLMDGLLAEFLPVPESLDAAEFYSNLAAHVDEIDRSAWGDGSDFAAAMQERIIDPGERAIRLLSEFPYLTRMLTIISPQEMLEDPIFHQNPDLEGVSHSHNIRRTLTCGDAVYRLPDGREVFAPGSVWPTIPGMPTVEDIEEVPPAGAPLPLVDNTETIDELLAAWNAANNWPGSGAGETGGTADTETDSGGAAGSDADGCGCRSASPPSGIALGLLLLGLRIRSRARP